MSEPRIDTQSKSLSFSQRISRYLKLNIERKLGIAFVGLSAASIVLVGLFAITTTTRSIHDRTIRELEHVAEEVSIRLQDFFGVVGADMTYILQSKYLRVLPDTQAGDQPGGRADFINFVRILMQNKPFYHEIKFLRDFSGAVGVVRTPLEGSGLSMSTRLTSWRYYKLLAEGLTRNQVAIVPIELRIHGSKGTISAFSFVMSFRSSDEALEGILIANVFASHIFSIVESSIKKRENFTAAIVDKEGHYLYHSVKKSDWNKLLAEKNTFNVFTDFSREDASRIVSGEAGYIEETNDFIYHLPLLWGSSALNQNYSFFLSQPTSVVFAPVRRFVRLSAFFVAAFLLLAFILSRLATKEFVQPIQDLQKGSDVIASGDFAHRLDIQTGDEIQDLAERFNQMAESIQERERKLHDYSFELEKKVLRRTHQLAEEKNKLQIILDNVPSAFILIDRDFQVLTASKAIQSLTGHVREETIGRKCYELFGRSSICDHCSVAVSTDSRITRSEFEIASDRESPKVVERISVPVHQDNKERMHLEIITDITARKEMQEQILQSEKLASIGEMAAVLAHEMRNSLTSANMLMQLLSQSDNLPKPDKESLEVALRSIQRIEKITEDLLSFSRPADLKKEMEDMSLIIEEGIQLSRPHFESQNIQITCDLDESVPDLPIDKNLFREVIMNILLNGAQSIGENGAIHVSLAQDILPRDLHGAKKSTNQEAESQEIILAKGSEVVTLYIEDTGPGISQDKLERIFDPFFTTKLDGTGLGLSMAKRVVSEHGGIIFAENGKQAGARISIILPISTAEVADAQV